MAVGRIVALTLLALLIAATSLVGQVAFRADQTLLRHRFAHAAIDSWLSPLEGENGYHEAFVSDAWLDMRRALDWTVPIAVRDVVEDAALEAFRADWIVSVVKRMHTVAYLYMRGREQSISLTIPLGEFRRTVTALARERLDSRTANDVVNQINQIPSSMDLWTAIPEAEARSIERWIRRIPALSVALQYFVPGLFLGLTLVFGRPGSALIASGGGLTASGAMMLALIAIRGQSLSAGMARTVRRTLPGDPAWIYEPALETFVTALRSGIGFAWLLMAIGVVLVGLGTLLVRRWEDSYAFVSSASSTIRDSIRDA